MPLKLAAMPFRTTVADVRRLEDGNTMLLLKIRTGLVTSFTTGTTVLVEFPATGLADIPVVGTGAERNAEPNQASGATGQATNAELYRVAKLFLKAVS